jgi:hypothetical protein
MNDSENIAFAHLKFRGFTNPVFEPDGQVTPDFVLDGRIAVEVRRLNKHERDSQPSRGLEETAFPLLMGMQKLAASFGPAKNEAWYLGLDFGRPFPTWPKLAKLARSFLEQVRDSHSSSPLTRQLAHRVELEVVPSTNITGDIFHLAMCTDDDSSGWVLEDFERSLRLCIEDKSRKTAAFRPRYGEWWLLLVDHVSYSLSEFSRAQFKQSVHVEHDWNRVIIVNPLDHTHYFEL